MLVESTNEIFLLTILSIHSTPSEIIPVHCNAVTEWRRVVVLAQSSTVSMQSHYKLIPLQLADYVMVVGWMCGDHVIVM